MPQQKSKKQGAGGTQAATQATQAGTQNRAQREVEVLSEHKWALIQVLMRRCFMSEEECKLLVYKICGTKDDAVYSQLLRDASQDLAFTQLKIKTVQSPVDRLKYVGLVNTVADDSSKVASNFSIPQREFFRAVLERIACSNRHADDDPATPCELQMEIMNLNVQPAATQATQAAASQAAAAGGKKLSLHEKETTLNDLINQGWLTHAPSSRSCICLGARTFLELADYLLQLDLPQETHDAWKDVL